MDLRNVLTSQKADKEMMTRARSFQFSASDVCNSSSEKPSGQNESWPWQSEAGYQDTAGKLETAGTCMRFCPKHNRVSSRAIKLHLKQNQY